jgi:predicted negative regulator of RcsB-dependent stress response
MKGILAAVAVVVVLVVGYLGYKYWQLQQMAAKYANAKEVAAESIEKEGNKWTLHMESVLAQPIDKVWKALRQPERSHEFIDAFKKSELKKEEGNVKTVEFQVQVLTLPLQTFVAQLTYNDSAHEVGLKTLSGPQDQNATYTLTALDPNKTLLVLDGTATDKVSVPLPLSVQKGAMRELFVNQVRAIQKGIEIDEAKAQQKPAA